jgi:hypothetical protein
MKNNFLKSSKMKQMAVEIINGLVNCQSQWNACGEMVTLYIIYVSPLHISVDNDFTQLPATHTALALTSPCSGARRARALFHTALHNMTLKKNAALSLQQYSHSTLSVTESITTMRAAVMAERSQQRDATNAPYFRNQQRTSEKRLWRHRNTSSHQWRLFSS